MSAPFTFRGIALPEHLKESIDAYVSTGRPCGDFLKSFIDNNLRMTLRMADTESLAALNTMMGYFYDELPSACWGHPNSHDSWCERKRVEREMEAAK